MTLELWLYVIVGVIVGSALTADALTRRTKPPSVAGTKADPRVEWMEKKQLAIANRMHMRGRSLLAGKDYTPELTKKAEPEPVSLYAIKGGKR